MVGFVLVDYGMAFIDIEVQNVLEEMEKSLNKKKLVQVHNARLKRGKKLTEYNHKGFAFDGTAGHDTLVTDGLMSRL